MNNEAFQEIEMQTYSMSYSSQEEDQNQLPYHWDGDCHLTLNHPYHESFSEFSSESFVESSFFEEEKESLNFPVENDSTLLLPMESNDSQPMQTESIVSIETISTENTNANMKEEKLETIDEQIDFILETVKKQRKAIPYQQLMDRKRSTRKRKTYEQLEILQKEIEKNEMMNKIRMKQLADKTGLKIGQVYKWYWDYKRKQTETM